MNNEFPMTKERFVRELSILSGFTISDTRIFFEAFCELLSRCIEDRVPFVIKGFASLKFKKIKKRMGYHGVTKEMIELPETTRAILSISSSLKELVGENRGYQQISFLDEEEEK